jgi:hypothetical protein
VGFHAVYIFRPAYIYSVRPRTEPNFGYRLLHAIYPVFRVLFPGQVIRADDLAGGDGRCRHARDKGAQNISVREQEYPGHGRVASAPHGVDIRGDSYAAAQSKNRTRFYGRRSRCADRLLASSPDSTVSISAGLITLACLHASHCHQLAEGRQRISASLPVSSALDPLPDPGPAGGVKILTPDTLNGLVSEYTVTIAASSGASISPEQSARISERSRIALTSISTVIARGALRRSRSAAANGPAIRPGPIVANVTQPVRRGASPMDQHAEDDCQREHPAGEPCGACSEKKLGDLWEPENLSVRQVRHIRTRPAQFRESVPVRRARSSFRVGRSEARRRRSDLSPGRA